MLPLLNEFKDGLEKEGLRQCTIENMVRHVNFFAKYYKSFDMRKVSSKDIKKFKIYIMLEHITEKGKNKGKKICVEYVISILCSLMKYFKFLAQRRHIFFDPTLDLEFPKKNPHFPDYIPSEKDVQELLQKPDTNTYWGIRDRLLFELAYTCPLRNQELGRLCIQDIDMKDRYIYPKREKGGYECGIPITDSTHQILEKYLSISRPRLLKGAKTPTMTDRLFITIYGGPFKKTTIDDIFAKYRGDKRIHPHLMRHACAVHMLKGGARIRDIQVLLGHRRLTSTNRYTRLTANDIKDIQDKYHPRERSARRAAAVGRI
ncbi:MAG: tyrosine-type recombinase/integrase [Candidatus Omnitrophota bacterium]